IAADATAAWVTHFSANLVSRIDATSFVVTSLSGHDGPGAVVAAEGSVWVMNVRTETSSEIDSENPARAPSTQFLQFRPGAVAVGGGSVWVINAEIDSVVPVGPIEGQTRVGDAINVGQEPVAVAAGADTVWISNSVSQTLSRLSMLLQTADSIPLDFTPGALALDDEADVLWVVDTSADAVVRYDIRSRDQASVSVGSRPTAIAIGADAVWVANSGDGTVSRIDPTTNEVVQIITIGGSPVGIAVGGDTVWVAVAER
ncbi:MAG: hypothetical protein ACRDFZ_07190, partial [Candidatus Limnocylindria bacterium]